MTPGAETRSVTLTGDDGVETAVGGTRRGTNGASTPNLEDARQPTRRRFSSIVRGGALTANVFFVNFRLEQKPV